MAKTNKAKKLKLSKEPIGKAAKKLKRKRQRSRTKPDSDSETESDKLSNLLELYSKDQLVELITNVALASPSLYEHVREVADRDVTHRKIFVYRLAWEATRESLVAAFEPYGEIEECTVVTDRATGKSKGYGFVVFKTRKGATKALKEPRKKIAGRFVSCQLASIGKGAAANDSNSAVKKFDAKNMGGELKGKNQRQGQRQAQAQAQAQVQAQAQARAQAQVQAQAQAQALAAAQNMALLNQYQSLNSIYSGLLANPGALGFVNPAMAGALGQGVLGLSQGNLGQGMVATSQAGSAGGGAGGSVLGAYGGSSAGAYLGSSAVPQLGLQHAYAANTTHRAQQTDPVRAKGGGASFTGYTSQMW